jgi:tetratricopeptide (TPR) repeat protein
MATIEEALNIAIKHHQAGELLPAEAIYRRVLSVEPKQSDALRLLGMVLSQQSRLVEAEGYFQQLVLLDPQQAAAHFHLGLTAYRLGRLEIAVGCFQQALALQPNFVEALINLGNVLSDLQRHEEALACFQRVVEQQPENVTAYINLGIVLLDLHRADEAIAVLLQARRINSEMPQVHYNLGRALLTAGQVEEATRSFEQAIQLQPDYAKAWNNLGTIALAESDWLRAECCFRRAIQSNPNEADHHFNHGAALQGMGDLKHAVQGYESAIQLRPHHGKAHNNLGTVKYALGQFNEAEACYRRAIQLDPQNAEAHNNFTYSLLQRGDWERGWQEYEWRFQTTPLKSQLPSFAAPLWQGESLQDKTLLVIAEQGLGDTLQFMRYLPFLQPAKLIFMAPPQMIPLLKREASIHQLIAHGDSPPPFDFCIMLLSVPRLLRTRVETVPRLIPYLTPDPNLVAYWQTRLAAYSGLRIGINWRGRPGTGAWRLRDLELSALTQWAEIPNIHWISLQFGDLAVEEQQAAQQMNLITFPDLDRNHGAYMDSAAIMQQLDLVISSDTSVPHLAGALGVPVWVALPLAADWRWMIEREDSPWYPSMRLFRQTQLHVWTDVIERIHSALDRLSREKMH